MFLQEIEQLFMDKSFKYFTEAVQKTYGTVIVHYILLQLFEYATIC